MAVKWGFRGAGGAKWRENGGTRTPSNVEFPAVSGVVCMSKVGGLDEIYPLTKKVCPLDEVLRLESGLAQANFVSFGPVPGGRVPVRDGYAARGGRCGPPRGVDSRRVFENRFTRSNVMAQRRRLGLPGSLL